MGFATFFKYWKNQRDTFRAYWAIYGGLVALLKSPYLHVALGITAACAYFLDLEKAKVSEIAISVIPNLLGFTVGAMAITLAFSSADLFKQLAEDGKPDSFFMKLMANLVHFILAQVAALVAGIVAKTTGKTPFEYVTLALLLYAILVTLSAGVQLFQAAIVYNTGASLPHDEGPDAGPKS